MIQPNRPLFALLIALFIHALLIGLFWGWITHDKLDEKPVYKEKRFGVTLSEESEVTEPSEATPPVIAPIERSTFQKPQSVPIPIKNIQAPSQKSELKPFSEADRDELPFSVLHHYGEEFFSLPSGEQHFIIDNLQKIRKINEVVGTRLLRDRSDVDPHDNNVVEFILNPDGTISDLTLEKNRIGTPLDELTLQTINLAHPKYPKPEQPTHIRIRVYIIVK